MKKQRRKNNPKLIIYILLLAIITAIVISGTFARYTSKDSKDGTSCVAKWSFNVNGLGNESLTRANIKEGTILGDKIAPGTEGYFTVGIDTTGCEVAVEYKVKILSVENKPNNLYFYTIDQNEEEVKTTNYEEYEINGLILANEATKVKTEKIYWKWEYETEGENADKDDTDDGKNIEQMTIDISIVGVQYLPQKYEIKYNLGGGELGEGSLEEYEVALGGALVAPTKEGYDFLGWTGSNGDTPQKEVIIEKNSREDKTYTANWKLSAPTANITANKETVNLFDSNVITTFTADTGTTKEITGYQWYYNGTAINGATANTYSINTTNMDKSNYETGIYTVKVTNATGDTTSEGKELEVITEIGNSTQLKNFANKVNNKGINFSGKTIKQTANINLNNVNWEPIGNFVLGAQIYFDGIYDGQYKYIQNLSINTQEHIAGLFGWSKGTIKNLGIESGSISTGTKTVAHLSDSAFLGTGGIVGTNTGTVENCYNKATVSGTGEFVAGIVGANSGIVSKCYNAGNISGLERIGGITGHNANAPILYKTPGCVYDCYNAGTITPAGGGWSGGITGLNFTSCTIRNCYNIGTVSGSAAGIVGRNDKTVENCYYLQGTSSSGFNAFWNAGSAQVTVKTSAEMKSQDFVNTLGSANWKIVSGKNNGYPILSWQ